MSDAITDMQKSSIGQRQKKSIYEQVLGPIIAVQVFIAKSPPDTKHQLSFYIKEEITFEKIRAGNHFQFQQIYFFIL